MAAAYGLSPFQVARWPWKKFQALWESYERRQRRKVKLEAVLRGADPTGMGGGMVAPSAEPRPGGVTTGEHRNGSFTEVAARKPPDALGRPPTDQDNWDLTDADLFRLSAKFPGSVITR